MIKDKDKPLITGLEIGTTNITILIGEILIDGMINIIGIGHCPSKGINKGNINDLESLILCIKKAMHEAEIMAKYHITNIYLALSDKYVSYKNEIGIVPIVTNEVTKKDIKYAIHTAKSVKLKYEHKILHTIPQEYSIDEEIGIKNPIGLSGIRMIAKVHLIIYRNYFPKNLIKAIKKCNLKPEKVIFSGLASSKAVLTSEERHSGVCIIDIGGGNMDIIIYINGYIQHSEVIPYAGNSVTNDIAYAFNTSFKTAEKIKIKHGSVKMLPLYTPELIDICNINDNHNKKIQKKKLIEVIQSRYFELLNIVNKILIKIQKKLYYSGKSYVLESGIVITGGSSQIKSLKSFAEKIFNMQVRIGIPINTQSCNKDIINPQYATIIGLLHYGKNTYLHNKNKINQNNYFKKFLQYVTQLFKKNKIY
ncbi:Cell division protein FtsA [Buchnera aphidicola (Phyllaphis fagi)]